MTEFSPWTRGAGDYQLRVVEPVGFEETETATFVLGSDREDVIGEFGLGDHLFIRQDFDLTGQQLVRARYRLRGPSVAPPFGVWRFTFMMREVLSPFTEHVLDQRDLQVGETVDVTDGQHNIKLLGGTGDYSIILRLEIADIGGPVPPTPTFFAVLPAVYLDDVALGITLNPIRVVNRSPEPNETGAAVGSNVVAEVTTLDPVDSILLGSVELYVNEVLVTPTLLPITSPLGGAPDGVRITYDPPSDFDSSAIVSVRVVADSANAHHVDQTHLFTAEDIIEPTMLSVVAIDLRTVRVQFSELMRMLGDGDDLDALTAASYTFSRNLDGLNPVMPIEPTAVTRVDDSTVDITTDTEMTPEAIYTLTLNSPADLAGNEVEPPNHVATFGGFDPDAPAARSFDLYRMLPQFNRDEDDTQDLYRFTAVVNEVVRLLLSQVDGFVDIFDVDKAPEQFVDAMLADLGNPFDFDLDLTQKRKLVDLLVEMYKLKGTAPGIIASLRFFLGGLEAQVLDYHDDGVWILGESELGFDTFLGSSNQRNKYSFDVIVNRLLTDDERLQVRQVVDFMKPGHTHHIRTLEP